LSISKRNQGNGRSKYRSSDLEFSVTLSLFIVEIISMEMSESVERKVNFEDSEFNCIIGASTLHLALCGSLRHSENDLSFESQESKQRRLVLENEIAKARLRESAMWSKGGAFGAEVSIS